MRTEKEKMIAGELYHAGDAELVADVARAASWMDRYNASIAMAADARAALLREGLVCVGTGVTIRPPFHIDYGYNITIGDKTQIGPGVQILAADHPRDPAVRAQMLEFGRPVTIGRNVWIGGGAILLPGVTVGDDALIGAGSVVTRDVPAGATVVGNPARVR